MNLKSLQGSVFLCGREIKQLLTVINYERRTLQKKTGGLTCCRG